MVRIPCLSRALAIAVCLGASVPVFAATFTVTRTDDTNDGTCDADCSLREAVVAANAAPGADTVVLPAGSYDLTIADATAGVDEDLAATGDLDIAGGGFTLQGAGPATTTIGADGLGNRIFHIRRDFSASPITIRGVGLERGDSSSLGSSGGGSAIRIDDSFAGLVVTLDDLVIEKNVGESAVRNVSTLHVQDCSFAENAVSSALDLPTANANKSFSSQNATRIERTTFRQNDGFAITAVKNENKVHQFELVNSTFSDNNQAGASGTDAAIFTTNSARIWNTTIADDAGYGLAALSDFYGTPLVEVQSTIFRSNTFGNVMPLGATDGAVLPASRGGNVVSDSGAGAFTESSDHVNTNPKLIPLANNGGKTLTYNLDPTSPAIDAGLNSGPIGLCPAIDQRGEVRPQDGNGDQIAVCDAGSVEVVPEPAAALVGGAALAALAIRKRRR